MGVLSIICTPSIWFQNRPYDAEYDAILNVAMDAGETATPLNHYEMSFAGYTLWTANYPYAVFTTKLNFKLKGFKFHRTVRPSRATILKLIKYLPQDYAELIKQQ